MSKHPSQSAQHYDLFTRDGAGGFVFSNINSRVLADGFRDGIYRRFLVDLHRHLVGAGETATVAFTSGFGQGRGTALFVGVLLGSGLFLVLPLILYAATNDWRMLLLLLFGAALMVPAWRVFATNQQASYDPAAPPDLLP
jgi:hypothetical protein